MNLQPPVVKILSLALVLVTSPLAFARADEVPGVAVQPDSYFYTGKPYDADLEGYVFACRTYSPNVSRWTTTDPRGFPESANNFAYVRNASLTLVDPNGTTGKSIVWLFGYTGTSENDGGDYADIAESYNSSAQQMRDWDQGHPNPNYLSDGDRFSYFAISSVGDIAGYADYNKIELIVHGRPVLDDPDQHEGSIPPNGEPLYIIGGTWYTFNQLSSYGPFSSDFNIITCGTGLGGIPMGDTVAGMSSSAQEYLRE